MQNEEKSGIEEKKIKQDLICLTYFRLIQFNITDFTQFNCKKKENDVMCDLALYRAKLQETRLNFNISVTVTQANFTNTHPTREQNK